MKATSYKLLQVSLSALVIFVGVAFFLPSKVRASNVIDQQPINDTEITTAGSNMVQRIRKNISSEPYQVQVYLKNATANGLKILRAYVSTSSTSVVSFLSKSADVSVTTVDTQPQFYTFTFTTTAVPTPNTTYYLHIVGFDNTVKLYGTTSSSYSGCYDSTSGTPVACGNGVTAFYYTLLQGANLSVNYPLTESSISTTTPVGQDFQNWVVQVGQVPATTTPLLITLTTGSGTDTYTIPTNGTSTTTITNITIPKTYPLQSFSSTTPTYYQVLATLKYSNSLQTITTFRAYFGIVSSNSTYTFGNFYTSAGYVAPDDVSTSTPSLTNCSYFNGNNISSSIARGLCNVAAFIIIPPSSLLDHLQSIPDSYAQKYPFVYLSQIKSAYESLDYTSPHYVDPTTDPEYRTYSSVTASSSVFNFTIITLPTNSSTTPTYMQVWVPITRKFILYSLYVAFVYGVYISVYDAVKRMGTGGSK